MAHKSGFVNILGNPNVGKSTLMNLLTGEKLSIITPKAQTTRHRILGFVNSDDYQVVFSDTPGILKPNYRLQQSMMKFVSSALEDADIFLYITDVIEKTGKNPQYIEKINKSQIPVLLIINKIDLASSSKIEALKKEWSQLMPDAEIFAISALKKINTDKIFNRILELLPEFPPYYPKDEQLTDRSERFFVSEIIREKILQNYTKEIPYSVEVNVEEFKESEEIIRIRTIIYVERPTQKGILIGHKGQSLKKTGTQARIDIEKFFGKKVYLETFVKVDKNWRNRPEKLKHFGYH